MVITRAPIDVALPSVPFDNDLISAVRAREEAIVGVCSGAYPGRRTHPFQQSLEQRQPAGRLVPARLSVDLDDEKPLFRVAQVYSLQVVQGPQKQASSDHQRQGECQLTDNHEFPGPQPRGRCL